VKAAVLGTGGLGRIITLELASDPRVNEIVIVDKRGDRSRALKSVGKTASVTALEADVANREALGHILAEADVAVNATLPENNLRIMEACFEEGCGYVDSSGFSPATEAERGGVLEQLALDQKWRDRGLTAIISMGSDPGISNIMARVAADRFNGFYGSRDMRGLELAKSPKRVGSIASEKSTSNCTCQNDGDGWTKRKLVDTEWLELTLPIGSDEDANQRAQHKATHE